MKEPGAHRVPAGTVDAEPEGRRQLAAALFEAHKTTAEVADALGVSTTTVRKYKRKLDVPPAPPGRPRGLVLCDSGEALEVARKAAGLTLQQLSAKTGIDTGTLSNLERIRGIGLGLAKAANLASVLGTTPAQLGFAAASSIDTHTVGQPRRGRRMLSGPRPLSWRSAIAEGHRRFWTSPAGELERAAREERSRERFNHRTRFQLRMGRWGKLGGDYLRRAVDAYDRARRGGAPKKTHLHERWRSMREGHDLELSELYDDEISIRSVAYHDWQRHPGDWPRDKWPASSADPNDIEPSVLPAARDRVKKALQRLGTKP